MGSDLFFSKSSRTTVLEYLDYYMKTSVPDHPVSYIGCRFASNVGLQFRHWFTKNYVQNKD
jgi:hypothetical protein